MIRLLALSTTALVALSALPAAAQILEAADGAVVDVLDTDVIDVNGVAVTITGDVATLNNDGFVKSQDDDAVVATGEAFQLNNGITGGVEADGKGVEISGANSEVYNDGSIVARNDGVEANVDGLTLINTGEIVSTEARGVQTRGFGAYIENSGLIDAFDEAVEGRDGFTLINDGIITSAGSDGVQFGDGVLENYGVITGSFDPTALDGDGDGVDIDSGSLINEGVITTNGSGAGVDVDAEAESGDPAPKLTILNLDGAEISGLIGIQYDDAATAEAAVYNEGRVEGFGGVAMQFAAGQGPIEVTLAGATDVIGDIVFGGADDLLTLDDLTSGGDALGGGVAFGGAGFDTLFANMDLLSLTLFGEIFRADYQTNFGDRGFIRFAGFEDVCFNNTCFDEAALSQITPIPLPAAGWLILAGVGGLAALRRRA